MKCWRFVGFSIFLSMAGHGYCSSTLETSPPVSDTRNHTGNYWMEGFAAGAVVGSFAGTIWGIFGSPGIQRYCNTNNCDGSFRDVLISVVFGTGITASSALVGAGIGSFVPKYSRVCIQPITSFSHTYGIITGAMAKFTF